MLRHSRDFQRQGPQGPRCVLGASKNKPIIYSNDHDSKNSRIIIIGHVCGTCPKASERVHATLRDSVGIWAVRLWELRMVELP